MSAAKQSHLLVFGIVLVVFWAFPVQGAVQEDLMVHSSSVWVQMIQGIADAPPLRVSGGRVLVAKGPGEEEYHPEPGESAESIRQKSEQLKARKGKQGSQEIPLVLPQDQGSGDTAVGSSGNEPALPHPQKLAPQEGEEKMLEDQEGGGSPGDPGSDLSSSEGGHGF